MTTELTMLTYAVALLIVLVGIQSAVGLRAQGVLMMAGHRDNLPPAKPYQGRTKRLVENHIENLAIFAPLVLVAAFAHISSSWTLLGAQLFIYSRIVHAILYLTGIPYARGLAWAIGFAGSIMILLTLLGILA